MTTTNERMNGIGRFTTRGLLDEITELREDIQAQSVILAEMALSIRHLFNEMRRANIARFQPPSEQG